MKIIKEANLKLVNYINQNIKVNSENHILDRLKEFFHS